MSGCILITGGAGFIGTNVAKRLAGAGMNVRILDSLARAGSEENFAWLRDAFSDRIELVEADVRDADAVRAAAVGVEHVYHLAAQVAVTTSLADPLADFDVNARGTLNVLEAVRASASRPSLVFSSTNKVYGGLPDIDVAENATRYAPKDERVRANGIPETRTLDFHAPYGCSKGAADQYVLDYARSFGLRTAVMRMSCIYGPHQHGNEDQGWVAHFVRCALAGKPVTIYGDGKQVRDVLFVDDLVNAFESARSNIAALSGSAFNLGGGVENTLSVMELVAEVERITGCSMQVSMDEWRVGDQRYYVSDTRRLTEATGWRADVTVPDGLRALVRWFEDADAPRATAPVKPYLGDHIIAAGASSR